MTKVKTYPLYSTNAPEEDKAQVIQAIKRILDLIKKHKEKKLFISELDANIKKEYFYAKVNKQVLDYFITRNIIKKDAFFEEAYSNKSNFYFIQKIRENRKRWLVLYIERLD